MWESLSKIASNLPPKWKYAGLAIMVGFMLGGGTAEGIGIYTQVEENAAFIVRADSQITDLETEVLDVNEKLDMVLCILVLEEDISPLTCAPGGGP